jgi:hypothetical protein
MAPVPDVGTTPAIASGMDSAPDRPALAAWWRGRDRRQRGVLVAVAVVEGALKVAMLRDLSRRDAREVRGPKWAWGASLLVNSAGAIPLAYFLFGRSAR